jgi:hypothetical protein
VTILLVSSKLQVEVLVVSESGNASGAQKNQSRSRGAVRCGAGATFKTKGLIPMKKPLVVWCSRQPGKMSITPLWPSWIRCQAQHQKRDGQEEDFGRPAELHDKGSIIRRMKRLNPSDIRAQ